MVEDENWVVVIPTSGEPKANVGYEHHFQLLKEIAPELTKEINFWAAGLQCPPGPQHIVARGEIDHLNRILFQECLADRNYVYDIVAKAIDVSHKFGKTSPFFDADNILNLFIARAMNEHIPDEQDINDVTKYSKNLAGCSTEQKRNCLEGIMEAENPAAAIRLAQETKSLKYLLPEVADTKGFWQRYKNTSSELFQHLLIVLDYVAKHSKNKNLRWAALLHDIGKPRSVWVDEKGRTNFHKGPDGQGEDHARVGAEVADIILKRLEISDKDREEVVFMVENHMFDDFFDKDGARDFLRLMEGPKQAYDMLTLRRADEQGKNKQEEKEKRVDRMRKLLDKVVEKDNWEEVSDPNVVVVLKRFDII